MQAYQIYDFWLHVCQVFQDSCAQTKFEIEIEISKDGETPLIGRIFKTKNGGKISKTQGISYSRIREVFKDYITDITAYIKHILTNILRTVLAHD